MPLHNQTRSSVRIREVATAVAWRRRQAQPTLLQLAQEYQSRDPAVWLEEAPHPLPTKSWFRYSSKRELEQEQDACRPPSVISKEEDVISKEEDGDEPRNYERA